MSSAYEEVPGTDATPEGYRWILHWPPRKGSSAGGIAFALVFSLFFAVLMFVAIFAHADGGPAGMIVMFGVLALFFPLTVLTGRDTAEVERIVGGVAVRRTPWKRTDVLVGLPLTLGLGIAFTMIGFEVGVGLFSVLGGVLIVFAVAAGIGNLANRRPIILTNDRVACGDSWSVDWQDITRLRGKTSGGRAPKPYVSFRTLDPHTISGASKRRYVIMSDAWSLDANGLLSLMMFMVENPTARTSVTPEQFEAMLAGPPRPSGKWWA